MAKTSMKNEAGEGHPARSDAFTLSREQYKALLARIEDLEDLRDLEAARAAPDREELPVELVKRLLAGKESKVKLWREHRGLTARALADKAGMAPTYLSEIETGKKPGSVDAMAKIARALGVLVDDLIVRSGMFRRKAGDA